MKLLPEWEEHQGTLLAWPQRPELWEGRHQEIEKLWIQIAAILSRVEEVHILINQPSKRQAIQENLRHTDCRQNNVFFYAIATDDVWIRDYGPIWINSKEALLFSFDGWGKKYAPYHQDDSSGEKILEQLTHKGINKPCILEGGAIDTDGNTLITTESCLLFRDPFWNKNEYEKKFQECFGMQDILWLKGGLPGDDTDGHIDMITRFVAKDKVLTSICQKSEAAYPILIENQKRIKKCAPKLEVQSLPLPPQVYKEGRCLPRSYANFYIANGVVLVPVYQEKTDELALKIVQENFPNHKIEAMDASILILEGGGIHCMTMQIPKDT